MGDGRRRRVSRPLTGLRSHGRIAVHFWGCCQLGLPSHLTYLVLSQEHNSHSNSRILQKTAVPVLFPIFRIPHLGFVRASPLSVVRPPRVSLACPLILILSIPLSSRLFLSHLFDLVRCSTNQALPGGFVQRLLLAQGFLRACCTRVCDGFFVALSVDRAASEKMDRLDSQGGDSIALVTSLDMKRLLALVAARTAYLLRCPTC
jgi:hypothetical protein